MIALSARTAVTRRIMGFEHDGDRTWVECDECGKEFRVSLSVTYEFRTDPIPVPEKNS